MEEATDRASGFDLAIAGIAGQMGGATGQALNLVIAMREHNKAQDAAAVAGGKRQRRNSPRCRKVRAFWLSVSRPSETPSAARLEKFCRKSETSRPHLLQAGS